MINLGEEDMSASMYSPDSQLPSIGRTFDVTQSTWDYAIDKEDDVSLEMGETKLLAVYRGMKCDNASFRAPISDHDEDEIIEQNDVVLLLKIKVEETDEDEL